MPVGMRMHCPAGMTRPSESQAPDALFTEGLLVDSARPPMALTCIVPLSVLFAAVVARSLGDGPQGTLEQIMDGSSRGV